MMEKEETTLDKYRRAYSKNPSAKGALLGGSVGSILGAIASSKGKRLKPILASSGTGALTGALLGMRVRRDNERDYMTNSDSEKTAFWQGFKHKLGLGRERRRNPRPEVMFHNPVDPTDLAMHIEEHHPHLAHYIPQPWNEVPPEAQGEIKKIYERMSQRHS
jgi:hypothetical protein